MYFVFEFGPSSRRCACVGLISILDLIIIEAKGASEYAEMYA